MSWATVNETVRCSVYSYVFIALTYFNLTIQVFFFNLKNECCNSGHLILKNVHKYVGNVVNKITELTCTCMLSLQVRYLGELPCGIRRHR